MLKKSKKIGDKKVSYIKLYDTFSFEDNYRINVHLKLMTIYMMVGTIKI